VQRVRKGVQEVGVDEWRQVLRLLGLQVHTAAELRRHAARQLSQLVGKP